MTAVDIVLINPGDRKQVYQGLGAELAAIEPPFWVAVIAAYLRQEGFRVAIIDANAENSAPDETAQRAAALQPLLSCVVVYGSHPSASTQNMTIAGAICRALSGQSASRVALSGLHPSALPERTMREEAIDFVVEGEGPDTLRALLGELAAPVPDLSRVPGLWYREGELLRSTPRAPLISDLDRYLPIAAWDLLPMHVYRAHNWHCFDDIGHRSPYGAVYTSLGCPYNCIFCCINAPFGKPGIRYRSPERVVEEIALLANDYGVKNLKIVDELFVLKEQHYMAIVDGIIERGLDLNIWAYARVDTIKTANLARMKQAGINWLALGIESASPDVRDGADKRMQARDIKEVVRSIREQGIRIIGNFIFGLPDDTRETMEETLQLAMELNCEFINFYCAMAYPGSRLYDLAVEQGWELPLAWHGFSQHGYDMLPLPTRTLAAREVLQFRDDAFHRYFANPVYLDMVEQAFGAGVREHLVEMSATRLKRKLLGN
ncbi:B12-binding domain-containing radical SAM protein [Trichlorobacter lovleyi]|uniref:B12-binding domain-containing radical SAM protein n=1 Tax=Trichlorobacter lovleyi TaxID=313985 RepID=UPI0023F15C08|nr:radical SAM protein [Trichlorobacter lovleyi]